jgi:AcrR family transcriptional regulator
MARTGRRKGGTSEARDAILDAAREAFADKGLDGATVRMIATAAGVDPALVHHYFGTKEQLFLATVDIPFDPGDVLPKVLAGDDEHLGERVVRMFLSVWDDPRTGPPLVALIRTSLQHDWSARLLRELVTSQILRRIIARTESPPEEAQLRAALVATQMIGIGLARYLLKLDPIASADVETIVRVVAPTIQRYLTEPLPEA